MNKKTVFITGAGAGIGRATAQAYAAAGWFVGAYDRDHVAVQALAQELNAQSSSQNVLAGALDVTNAEQWQQALEAFFQHTGRLDILVNNAGILYSGRFEEIGLQQHLNLLNINLNGVITGCYTALPYLKQTPQSRVINVSSASAIYGQPSLSSYSASKCAVRGLTEALDNEWCHYGIRVVDVMPLFVQTALVKDMQSGAIDKLGVHLSADDVAQAIVKLSNRGAKFLPIHTPIGLPSRLLYSLASLTPDRINHWINGRLAK
ncbi:MAG: SDR family oxidoreductase [Moraxellaceae bacterium]|nr:MAG: SDR family oxidoreductase [Moraxellaceae bacterium]